MDCYDKQIDELTRPNGKHWYSDFVRGVGCFAKMGNAEHWGCPDLIARYPTSSYKAHSPNGKLDKELNDQIASSSLIIAPERNFSKENLEEFARFQRAYDAKYGFDPKRVKLEQL